MAEWVNVFETAVLDMKAEGLLSSRVCVWHLFRKERFDSRAERVLVAAEGEHEFAAVRGALIKIFLDTTISQEKRSVPDRKKPRDGTTGRYTAHETDARDADEDPNSEEEESGEEETDLTTAFEREIGELASVVKKLEDTLDVQDVEDLRELSESMYEGLATIRETHAKFREKKRNRGCRLPPLT